MTCRPTLLCYRPLGLGDLLVIVPALRALADHFPNHRRILVTPRCWEPLTHLAGGVDEVIDTPRHTISHTPFVPPPVSRPDVVVNFQGRGPDSHLMLKTLEPSRMIAFGSAAAGVEGPCWRPGEHEVAKWCRLLSDSGIPADPRRLRIPVPDRQPPARAVGAVLVHPGAAYGARRWPVKRWIHVVRQARELGREVVVTGSRDEAELAHEIAAAAGLDEGAVLAGRTDDVLDLAAAVAAADVVIAPDSGPAHLATALGRPSVTLFGPSSPQAWGPPRDEPRHRVLWHGTTGDAFTEALDPGLARITADEVLAELETLLTEPVRGE
ncbi:glycosyltransferase family 9 protein [Streptomyces antimycoticus]|uniref:glycosyltransferase family 9 protein n=1 Tax=Streptomyces antimycoticus TaxID=68175 RepID=UPI000A365E0E|nr:glycosyltransferase family 9 protein [Streptomyces antimycoticus]